MIYDFAPKLAHLLTTHVVPVQKGDFVVIETTAQAMPMIEALTAAIIERGGIPHPVINLPLLDEYFAQHAADEELEFINPIDIALMEKADVLFNIDAPEHTGHMMSVSSEKLAKFSKTRQASLEVFFRRISDGSLRWNTSTWLTAARAQQAGRSFYNYERFLYEAYALHLDDPVNYWTQMAERQGRLVEWLTGKSQIEVRGPGIDLSLSCAGRTWYSAHGEGNLPDGEILTCPIEDSVNGFIEFSYPTYYQGNRVENVRLVYKDGLIVEASADKGEAYLLSQMNMDENARRMGEFAIGTNDFIQEVTGLTLLDEKIGGTIHMAIGQSAAPAEGKNPSKIHWDMVHNMRNGGEIRVDGTLMYQNGKFLI
ncbi:MAG: aminopeptidase [Chitinophagaceae bacterium]|nr:aminopeptidase [Anaerolineae bacterium]